MSANRMLAKTSLGQHVVRKRVSEEMAKFDEEEIRERREESDDEEERTEVVEIEESRSAAASTKGAIAEGESAIGASATGASSMGASPIGASLRDANASQGTEEGSEKGEKQENTKHIPDLFMILFIIILSCLVLSCLWRAADSFGAFLPKSRKSTARSQRLRKALTVEADSATDRSDLEWCNQDAIKISGASPLDIEVVDPHWNAESLKGVLHTHSASIACMWTQEQLEHFAKELSARKARLAREGKSLLRVVDVLILLVVYEQDSLVLQEFARPAYQKIADEDIKECTVKSRFRTHEGLMECAQRCLHKLGDGMGRFIEIVPDILGMREARRELRNDHPGLSTLMQYYVVEARVVATDQHDLDDLGLLSKTLHVAGYTYKWDHRDRLPYVKRHLKHSWGASRQGAVTWMGLSHSFVPVLPWTENAVLEELRKRGFPDRVAPRRDAMKALVEALSEGHVSLGVQHESPPRLVCLEEKVSVVITSPREEMILLGGFGEDGVPILPSIQRYASEGYWRTAVRLSQTHLGLSAPLFQMEGRVRAVIDEVDDVKGQEPWKHVTRKYILRGPLIESGFGF